MRLGGMEEDWEGDIFGQLCMTTQSMHGANDWLWFGGVDF